MMKGVLQFWFLRKLIELVTTFVPRGGVRSAATEVVDQDTKHERTDLSGWEYCKVSSSDGSFTHRYLRYPSERPDAPVMVFLHGLNLDGRSFLGMKELAQHFDLYAYTFPEATDRYTGDVADFVALIEDFAAVLGLDSFNLVGVSFGGMIALRFAGEHPSAVKALILISSRIPGFTEELRKKLHILADMIAGLEDHKIRWLLERLESRHFRKLSAHQRALTASVLQPKQIAFYRQAAASMRDYNGRRDAEELRCPTLLILGTEDVLIPLESHEHFKETVKGITIELLHGAQHDISLLQPELVCEHIRSFLGIAS